MSRALLLAAASLGAMVTGIGGPPAGARPLRAQAPDYREQTADQQVLHALNRLGFGPRPGDVAKVRAMGVDRWIEQQLHPERIDDAGTQRLLGAYAYLAASPADMTAAYRAVQQARRREARQADDSATARQARQEALRESPELRAAAQRVQRGVSDVESAKLLRAVASERQLQEVMVDFWANHFSVFKGKGLTRLYVGHYDREVIRPHALGRFRDLLGAVAKSPAMLFYLDNAQSIADSNRTTLLELQAARRNAGGRPGGRGRGARRPAMPQPPQRRARGINENYARELLELHTLGVDGGYTQQDVMEVARALTGWSIDPERGAFVFRAAVHDADAKQVLGRRLAPGRGMEDGEEVLDLLARHPSTAQFIARKLVVRFVSDSAPPQLVERAAQAFLRSDGDIREVVRTIVTSPEFFSAAAFRAKVKTPFELAASALRAMNAQPDTTPRTAQLVARLGQPIYGRQTPDGWPDDGGAWINAGAILNRMNFGLMLASGRVPGVTLARWPHAAGLRGAPKQQQVDVVIAELLGGAVSRETRQVLESGSNPLLDRAPAANDREMGLPPAPRLGGLAQTIGLALGAPEFQRR